ECRRVLFRARKRGNDAFLLRPELERFESVRVRNSDVLCAPSGVQVCVLWADAGLVQAGRDGVGHLYLTDAIAHQEAARTVQDADGAVIDGGAMLARI